MDIVTHFGLSQDPFRTPEPGSLAGGTLTHEAARAYLAGRIAGAGGADLFSPAALDILAEAADGDPDLLRRLGGSALFHAAFEGARRVEDQHARQAVATQGRGAAAAEPSSVEAAPVVAPAAVHTLDPSPALTATVAPDPIVVHRRWWRRTPPMTRLAIVVGALLLSLPIIGYAIGVVKDSQASESSYLSEDSIVDQPRIAPAEVTPGGELVATTDRAAAEIMRPPVDLLAAAALRSPDPRPVSRPQPEPVLEAPLETVDTEPEPMAEPASEPAPVEVPAPPEIETVPIDPPAEPSVEDASAPTPQR